MHAFLFNRTVMNKRLAGGKFQERLAAADAPRLFALHALQSVRNLFFASPIDSPTRICSQTLTAQTEVSGRRGAPRDAVCCRAFTSLA
jgi:hypothetical protein